MGDAVYYDQCTPSHLGCCSSLRLLHFNYLRHSCLPIRTNVEASNQASWTGLWAGNNAGTAFNFCLLSRYLLHNLKLGGLSQPGAKRLSHGATRQVAEVPFESAPASRGRPVVVAIDAKHSHLAHGVALYCADTSGLHYLI